MLARARGAISEIGYLGPTRATGLGELFWALSFCVPLLVFCARVSAGPRTTGVKQDAPSVRVPYDRDTECFGVADRA